MLMRIDRIRYCWSRIRFSSVNSHLSVGKRAGEPLVHRRCKAVVRMHMCGMSLDTVTRAHASVVLSWNSNALFEGRQWVELELGVFFLLSTGQERAPKSSLEAVLHQTAATIIRKAVLVAVHDTSWHAVWCFISMLEIKYWAC